MFANSIRSRPDESRRDTSYYKDTVVSPPNCNPITVGSNISRHQRNGIRSGIMEVVVGGCGVRAVVSPSLAALKWLLLVLVCLKCCVSPVLGTTSASPLSTTSPPNCSAVTHLFEARGINPADIIREPINEVVLRYCELPATGICCTYNMETRLAGASRIQLERNTKEAIGKLSSVLATRAQKFNDFFRELLSESKKEFHEMFKRTYGIIYEQNAYVFSDLFAELENYYARGKVDLAEAMDSFFNTLYQKMFTVLNSQYSFDDKYLGCVSEHMKGLKPFGDVPDKLSVQIKRSFVATRTYVQALNTAADVAKTMINIRPNSDCTAALTKMQQCSACKGFTEKPCANYCVNVMKGCLQYYNELEVEWDNFVSSMERVSERLLGPFNIVMVVEPINIKISEAIMNFQETGHDISAQVFQGCGRPVLGRRKRSLNPKFMEPNNLLNFHQNLDVGSEVSEVDGGDTLDIDASIDGEEIFIDRVRRSAEPATRELQQFEPVQFSDSEEEDESGGSSAGGSGQRGRRKNKKRPAQGNKKNGGEEEETNKEPVLDKLVKDIRIKVKDSKKFWSNLPYQICNNEDLAAAPGADSHCWNGNTVDRYTHPIANDQKSNPEFPPISSTVRQSSAVSSQLFHLRTAVNHLRNAYNGLDVEWSDQEEPYYGSGSGSGGGSDDEDDSGSGLGSFEDDKHAPEHDTSGIGRTNLGSGGVAVPGQGSGSSPSPKGSGSSATPKGSGSSATTNMSLRRALITYLFPIYMAWFGGIISDLL